MQLSRAGSRLSMSFDDPNLVAFGGLAPAMALAQRAGLSGLVADRCTRSAVPGSANAHVKVPALVAGMLAGADCIDDLDLLRHGGMGRLFAGVRAPSTIGTFLPTLTFGHVRQLDSVASAFLVGLTGWSTLLPVQSQLVFLDVDDTIRETHGYAKQGAS